MHASGNSGERDTHDVTPADSPEIRLLAQYAGRLPGLPVALEWQNGYSAEAVDHYQRIADVLA